MLFQRGWCSSGTWMCPGSAWPPEASASVPSVLLVFPHSPVLPGQLSCPCGAAGPGRAVLAPGAGGAERDRALQKRFVLGLIPAKFEWLCRLSLRSEEEGWGLLELALLRPRLR